MLNRRPAMLGLAAGGALAPVAFVPPASAQPASAQTARTFFPTKHTAMTLMGGTLAKQTSKLALERARHAAVRQFVTFEIAEQTAVAQVLTDVSNPPPVPLDADHAAVLKTLQATPACPAFDRAYVQAQIQGHEKLLMVQQGYLDDTNRRTDGQHIAVLARVSIQQHLSIRRELQRLLAA